MKNLSDLLKSIGGDDEEELEPDDMSNDEDDMMMDDEEEGEDEGMDDEDDEEVHNDPASPLKEILEELLEDPTMIMPDDNGETNINIKVEDGEPVVSITRTSVRRKGVLASTE